MDGGADGSGDGSCTWLFDNQWIVKQLDVKMAAGFGYMDFFDDMDNVVFRRHFLTKRTTQLIGLEKQVLDRFLVLDRPCLFPVERHSQLVLKLEVGRLRARAPCSVIVG